jgi:hypothetical protein
MKNTTFKNLFLISIFVNILFSCDLKEKITNDGQIKNFENKLKVTQDVEVVEINSDGFYGKYVGVEFNSQGDIAHQFSNKTAKVVGKFLKQSYSSGNYLKVDFNNTVITTNGLDKKGKVEFIIKMPFVKTSKCDAFTGIAHCGTWVNQSNVILDSRDKTLLKNLNRISVGAKDQEYFSTDQGYKEYWIQFKHKKFQKKCF